MVDSQLKMYLLNLISLMISAKGVNSYEKWIFSLNSNANVEHCGKPVHLDNAICEAEHPNEL